MGIADKLFLYENKTYFWATARGACLRPIMLWWNWCCRNHHRAERGRYNQLEGVHARLPIPETTLRGNEFTIIRKRDVDPNVPKTFKVERYQCRTAPRPGRYI